MKEADLGSFDLHNQSALRLKFRNFALLETLDAFAGYH